MMKLAPGLKRILNGLPGLARPFPGEAGPSTGALVGLRFRGMVRQETTRRDCPRRRVPKATDRTRLSVCPENRAGPRGMQ